MLYNYYFWKQDKQDVKRKLAASFVLIDQDLNKIKGYFILSSNGILIELIQDYFKKNLPNSFLPTISLGRLAIDKEFQGKGFGAMFFIDALKLCFEISDSVGALAIVVDSIDYVAEQI